MLDYIRKKSSSKFASALLILMGLAMGAWGVQSFFYSSNVNPIIAKVGDYKLSQADFLKSFNKQKLDRQLWSKIQHSPEKLLILKKQILSQILYQQGTLNGFENYNYCVDNSAIRSTLSNIDIFQVDGEFDFNRYNLILRKLNITEDEILNQIKFHLMNKQLESALIENNFLLDSEITDYNKLSNQSYNLNILTINPEKLVKYVQVSAEEVKSYYNKNINSFKEQPFLELEYVNIPYKLVTKNLKLTNSELIKYYQKHLNDFTQLPSYKVEVIKLMPTSKLNNSSKAILHSLPKDIINKLSKLNISNNWNISKTTTWIKSSTKFNNNYSNIIKVDGYYIIYKLLATKHKQVLDFDKVKDKISSKLLTQKQLTIIAENTDLIAEKIYTTPNSLINVANQYKVKINNINISKGSKPNNGVFADTKVWEYLQTANLNENSDIIQLKSSWLILRPIKLHSSNIKPLSSVKADIKTQLLANKARKLAKKIADGIIAEPYNKFLSKYDLTWEQKNNFKPFKFDNNNINLSNALSKLTSKKIVVSFNDNKNSIVLLKLIKQNPNNNESNVNTKDFINQLSKLDVFFIKKGLLKNNAIKIFIDDKYLTKIN